MTYRKKHHSDWQATLILGALVAVLYGSFPLWATDEDSATRALQAQSFTAIEFDGYRYFDCGHDIYSTAFSATNATGRVITGVVCCGLLKSCTVRTD